MNITIRGDGVAARCCAHLLRTAGFRVAMERIDRPRVPAIMLSDPTVALIRDVFAAPSLFSDLPRVTRRLVAWGENASPIPLPHSAVVLSEQVLLESLGGFTDDFAPAAVEPKFVVYASGPPPENATQQRFGTRRASAVQVAFDGDPSCIIESLEDGWLFLVPNAPECSWLLGIGAPAESLLARSRVIAPRISLLGRRSEEFAACPRIVSPLCGDGWLACGASALGFDPICGDGTAHAIREAVLASAVIRAIANNGEASSLFSHYEKRLTAGMRRHLALCAEFYRTGGSGPWWQTELQSLAEGYDWCTTKLATAGQPRYRLRGFELTPATE